MSGATAPAKTNEEPADQAPYGCVSMASDGTITNLNSTFARWMESEKEALIGRPFRDLLSAGSRIYYETHLGPLLAMQGAVKEVALELQPSGRAALPVLASAVLVKDAGDQATLTRLTLFDMSDRHRFETELILARRKAEAAQQRFERLFEATPEATLLLDRAGTVLLANAEAVRLFGRPRSELIGRDVETMLSAEGEHPSASRGALVRAAEGLGSLELAVTRPDGSQVPVETRLSPADPTPAAPLIASLRDSTERRAVQHERDLALAQRREFVRLQEVSRFKTAFVNTAAHELRTPLTPIRLQLAILSDRTNGTASEKDGFAVLKRNVERLGVIVEDLLTVAAAQAGTLAIRPQRTDLLSLAGVACHSFDAAAARKSMKLTMSGKPAWAMADPVRIHQVFLSLLGNAFKFTPAGGTIEVAVADLGSAIRTTIKDSGIGIAPDDLPRLFEPFVQVHETADVPEPGSGLGLYICRQLVELHGGTIGLTSPGLGAGASASVILPKASLGGSAPRP